MRKAYSDKATVHRGYRPSAFLLLLAVALAAAPSGVAAKATLVEPGVPTTLKGMTPQGYYVVFAQTANGWAEAGRIACDKEFRTQTLDLSALLPVEGIVRLRLAKAGGGAAHVDAISLGGR